MPMSPRSKRDDARERRWIPSFAARESFAAAAWAKFSTRSPMSHEFRAGYHRGWADAVAAVSSDVPLVPNADSVGVGALPLDPEPERKRVLITHPHDGHGPYDTCLSCEKGTDHDSR